ncbi:MAG: T9SS type A sorting domain-containing protein [Bacteroidetes bacterium]|nr:MAG: T9SS type A sorting domain-containing protein [Bacteroidota bacterium]
MKKAIYIFLVGFLLFFFIQFSHSQIVINEVSTANDAVIADEEGDFEDWIELYNPTNATISLNKYTFLYEVPNEIPVSWTFPEIFIKPKQHLLIFASKKDRKEVIDHWEVPIFPDSIWRYKVNTTSGPAANWYQPTYSDASWLQGVGGFGYGDGDDQTNTGTTSSVYLRKLFSVTDTGKCPLGVLKVDYDDAFVAYLNGVEIARSNIGVYGDHPAYTVSAIGEHEAKVYQDTVPPVEGWEYYFIPKQVIRSALKPGNNVLSIQAHNHAAGFDDLSVRPYFILGVTDTTAMYPSIPFEVYMHTNFSLSNAKGFVISLKDSLGNLSDTHTFQPQNMQVNNSKGRNPDGGNNWCYFHVPTPDDTNDITQCFGNYAQQPSFNLPSGFYSGTQTLSVTVPPGAYVSYTRNGDTPDGSDPVYTAPITIDSTQVIRARAFSSAGSDLPSKTITSTYFINENISAQVISLCTDSVNLWDWQTGIYVKGPGADSIIPYRNANFWMDWKRQANIEFFDLNDTLGFEQECAIAIHGNYTRSFPQRSFRVYANDDYGDPYMNYQIFQDKNINKFRSFNIRNAGFDWNTCHMRDRLMHKMAQNTNIDVMDGEPVVLFLNGQYWGLYEMRERQDEYYLAENHNVDPENVDLLRFEGDIVKGTNTAFFNMAQYIGSNNMAIQANYDSALKLIDLPNYCDYFIAEIYYDNYDWIYFFGGSNNIKIWRTITPPGKWRYILWDVDLGLRANAPNPIWGIGTYFTCEDNNLGNLIASSSTGSVHASMFGSLLANNAFRNYFITRYADLMNTTFHPVNFRKKIYQMRDEMLPDMARQFAKWAGPVHIFPPLPAYAGRATDIPSWMAEVDTMADYTGCRPYHVRDSLQAEFSLVKQVDITLDVSPAGAGNIKLNTINKLDSLPWTGVYFDGVPVTMTATANTGYVFSHWQSPILIPTPVNTTSVTLNVTTNELFTAYFTPIPPNVNSIESSLMLSVFPNPFSGDFSLSYTLLAGAKVSVKLYDRIGQEVAGLLSSEGKVKPGTYNLKVDSRNYSLTSGVYFIQFTAGEFSKMIKLVKTND